MTSKVHRCVWDSCVIINYLEQTPGRYELIAPMIAEAEKGQLDIVVSEISVVEVAKLARLGQLGVNTGEQVALIQDWFERPYIFARSVDRGISQAATTIKRNFQQSTCDSIILATAIAYNVDVLYTFDGMKEDGTIDKMLALDGKLTKLNGDSLSIAPPNGRADGQTSLQDLPQTVALN